MPERDSRALQHDVPQRIVAELYAAGLEDAYEIGRGGFGIVFRCMQRSLDRTVAVKVLTSGLNSENLDRFVREQLAMGRLSGHPNIANVLQIDVTPSGLPYIVMQHHPRGSLDGRIRRDGPLHWGEALRLGVKMAGALETAHRREVLHRDVKPANILLTDYGEPQLADFGIARIAGAFETTSGAVTGSPAFTAPEVLSGDAASPASDLYGLGATLFCAITGHAPFERHSGEQVIAQFLRITTQPVPDLRGNNVPDNVRAAIERAMARCPRDRPSSAAVFGDQLREAESEHNQRVDDMAVPLGHDCAQGHDSAHGIQGDPSGRGSDIRSTEIWKLPQTLPRDGTALKPIGGKADPKSSSRPSRNGNLPLVMTGFIGRRREVAAAKNLLASARLVTLTGMGGVGKTRLAIHLAEASRRAFSDGVWLIEFGELRDPMLVTDTVSRVLMLRPESARSPLSVLAEYLAERRLLLVLDNCEHLVDAVAALSEPLLQTCPGLNILATSREPLGIRGEAAMRVPPLDTPCADNPSSLRVLAQYESVALFVDRAAAAVSEFDLTDQNMEVVAQICRQLDGLPLPIELAAARLRAMSVQQILDRLTDRYQLLTVGNRNAPSRQQTLRLCIDWSYELCTPREQQLWGRLSVFAGSFELDAAEAICANDTHPADLLDVVASLVDKSVLIREEHGSVVRFRLLQTLRDYGREKALGIGEYAAFRRRHRDWYEQFVIEAEGDWISPRQLEWISRLDREQPNLRDALQFCLDEGELQDGQRIAAALFQFWKVRGRLGEGRLWLDRVVNSDRQQPTVERSKALYSSSVLAGIQGETLAATALLRKADEVSSGSAGIGTSAVAGYAAGCLALFSADPAPALICYKESLAVARERHDLLYQTASLLGLALAYSLQGEQVRAVECHEQLLALTEQHQEVAYRGQSSWVAGLALWRKGDVTGAVAALEAGLRLTRLVDDPVGSARCLQALGWIEADLGHQKRAAVLIGATEGLWHDIGGSPINFPDMRIYHTEAERQIRSALGSREVEMQFQRGIALGFANAVAYALNEHPPKPTAPSETATSLTRREQQVAELVAEGLTNRSIAQRLVISQRTAQGHVEHILVKLGFSSRTQIAAWVSGRARDVHS
ncbi:protein kinase [Rhodococcus sp. WS4]|nr:protein kinase [Rhodococcus sp. WS4]